MANSIKGLHSHNFTSTGREELIAVTGTKTWAYRSGSWLTGATMTNNKDTYLASYLDKVFGVNDTDKMVEYNGSYWTFSENSIDGIISKFIFSNQNRVFLFNIKISNTNPVRYASRVWYSELPLNNAVAWGFEEGTDLVTTAGSAVITSASSLFKSKKIKIADPIYIITGSDKRTREYTIQSVDSETQLTLTEQLTATGTGIQFWTGSNWFDVAEGDGDSGNGIGMASNEIVLFKKNSVHRYNVEGETLRQIKDVPGTTSPRSIVSWGGYCYWYHPSGIYRTTGGVGEKISDPIYDIIEGVVTANQTAVVGWHNQIKNTVNFYLGDITLRDGDTVSDCVISLDLNQNIWSPRSYDRTFTVATNWLRSSVPEVYAGDDAQGVFQLDTGTQFKTTDIPFGMELYPIYPVGEDALVTFHRLRMYVNNGPDIQVFYRLMYKPRSGVEGVWDNDNDWHAMEGSQIGDRVDWLFPAATRASGVKLKIVESSGDESFLWEKMTLYYSDEANF